MQSRRPHDPQVSVEGSCAGPSALCLSPGGARAAELLSRSVASPHAVGAKGRVRVGPAQRSRARKKGTRVQ